MNRETIDIEVLAAVAAFRVGPTLVSPDVGGGVISFDENSIARIETGGERIGFVEHRAAHTEATLKAALLSIFDNARRYPTVHVSVPLFHGSDPAASGIHLYYRESTQSIYATPFLLSDYVAPLHGN